MSALHHEDRLPSMADRIAELESLIEWHHLESGAAPDFDDRCKSRNACRKYREEVARLKAGEAPTLPTVAEAIARVRDLHNQFQH
jgi:hypothetical protein